MIYSRQILETFLAVGGQGSFSQAARILDKSQACVSMQIAQMERELGLPLIDRSARPLALTDAGIKFREFTESIVHAIDECAGYMKEMAAGTAGDLKIGTSTSLGAFIVAPVLANIVKAFPNLSIQITVLGRPAVYEAIRGGEIHFGIVLADNPPGDLVTTHIRREPLYFVSSKRHPLARKRSVSFEELSKTPFVIGTKGHDYTTMIDQALHKMGVDSYHVGLRISNFEGMKKAVFSGIGIGILPRFVIEAELRQKTLSQLHVRGASLSSNLIFVERRKIVIMPTIERIKKAFLGALSKQGRAPR